jgi:hypothetical protein
MAEVLCVYRQVKILKQAAAASKKKRPSDTVAIIAYDEKPGIQAIATTAPDLPPEPGAHEFEAASGDAGSWSRFVNRCEDIIAAENDSWVAKWSKAPAG